MIQTHSLIALGALTLLGLAGCAGGPAGGGGGGTPSSGPYSCAERASVSSTGVMEADDPVPNAYIVMLSDKYAGIYATAQRFHAFASEFLGIKEVEVFSLLNGFTAKIPPAALEALLKDSRVAYIEQVGRFQASPSVAPATASLWGLDRIDQRDLPLDGDFTPGGSGSAVHVYVLDTGVDGDHPDYRGRLAEGYSVHGGLEDAQGHGTHVAGTVAGRQFGVAKQATLHNVRVLDASGFGDTTDIIRGIEWTAQHARANGWPAVANLSLGGGVSKGIDDAVCKAIDAGVAFVVAAGNEAQDACNVSPARVREAITVGATDPGDQRTLFSNYGQCVDIFAPGARITSAAPGGGSQTLDGTSMASPHVAGVAALCLQRGLARTPAQVRACVLNSATTGRLDSLGAKSPDRLLYAKVR